MLKDDFKSIKSERKDLRGFGLVVGGVFLAIGIITLLRHKPVGPYFTAIGAPLVLLGLAAPSVLRPVQRAWMGMAVVMGFVMTRIILSAVFFLVIMPMGVCMRLAGKRMLDLTFDRSRRSYWITKEKAVFSKQRYEKQF